MKRLLLYGLVACLLCACARTGLTPPAEMEQDLWQKMLAAKQESGPYRIQFSLRFGEENNTRRVTGILWGNGQNRMRMDIMAGVGATLAKMEDDPDKFVLYMPREGKAYYQDGPVKPSLKVGTPLPFNLPQLAALLNGHYGDVFGKSYAAAERVSGQSSFRLEFPPGGTLELDDMGRPVSWKQNADGWQLSVIYNDSDLPDRLKLLGPDGKRAIISVKDREIVGQPFDAEQMRLSVPENTPRLPLSKYKAS